MAVTCGAHTLSARYYVLGVRFSFHSPNDCVKLQDPEAFVGEGTLQSLSLDLNLPGWPSSSPLCRIV